MSEEIKPLHTEHSQWKGVPYTAELYAATDASGLVPIKQIQAVCFTEDDQIVFQKHVFGWNGLPGGHLEEGEDLTSTLKREIMEEISAELLDYGVAAYEKVWNDENPNFIYYHLKCWAKVKLLDKPIEDPDKKSLGRVICSLDKASEILGWGEPGRIIIELANRQLKPLP